MATPYGLAYGIGAGLSGIPQAAIQGLGMNQQMQQRDLQIADMQRQQAEERALSEAVQSGAARGLGYGDIAKEAAAKGAGGMALLKLREMAQKEQAAQRQAMIEDTIRNFSIGNKRGAIAGARALGANVVDYNPVPDDPNFLEITDDSGNRSIHHFDEVLAGLGGTGRFAQGMWTNISRRNIAQSNAQAKADEEERKRLEANDPNTQKNLQAWARIKMMGIAKGGNKVPATVQTANAMADAIFKLPPERRPAAYRGMATRGEIFASVVDRLAKGGIGPNDEAKLRLAGTNAAIRLFGLEDVVPTETEIKAIGNTAKRAEAQARRDRFLGLLESVKPESTSPRPAATPKPLKPVGKITLD